MFESSVFNKNNRTSWQQDIITGVQPKICSGCKSVKQVQNLVNNFIAKLGSFLNINLLFMGSSYGKPYL